MKNRRFLAIASLALCSVQTPAALYVNDNFPAFTAGNLVGQNGWGQVGSVATLPLQVAGGQVVMPAGLTGDNQDAWRSLGTTISAPISGITPVYVGLTLTINQATPASKSPSYFFGLTPNNDGTGFVNFRLSTTNDLSSGPNGYRFLGRVTGQTGSPWSLGSVLQQGVQYSIIIEAGLNTGDQNDTMRLFVNPTSTDIASQTPDLVATLTSGGGATDPVSLGSFILSQFSSSSSVNSGVSIGSVVVGDQFGAVVTAIPEPGVLSLGLLGGLVWLIRRRAA